MEIASFELILSNRVEQPGYVFLVTNSLYSLKWFQAEKTMNLELTFQNPFHRKAFLTKRKTKIFSTSSDLQLQLTKKLPHKTDLEK